MGFLIKTLLGLAIVGVVGGFAINEVPGLKQKVIETANPAAKERRILGEMRTNLDQIENNLEISDSQKDPAKLQERIKNSRDLLKQSRELLNSALSINNDTGIIGSQMSKIIDAFSDKTPYPAEDLTQAPSTGSGQATGNKCK